MLYMMRRLHIYRDVIYKTLNIGFKETHNFIFLRCLGNPYTAFLNFVCDGNIGSPQVVSY